MEARLEYSKAHSSGGDIDQTTPDTTADSKGAICFILAQIRKRSKMANALDNFLA